ncbi:hypothetical protein [Bradyrhizobium sp. CB2312]|uniref:hypothetical protein n=1 Tax=Bradyrhizobium sp. CB2312 TaxID=3039155 RepID=UPI0024B2428D|nr:hypothetical protein [Bradyrhizobium sp. CB2312]WFU73115.1 hypothetical protein QA642_03275 [Bradyrhizobium sp. CB2312]
MEKTSRYRAVALMAAWLLLLAMVIAAIMPHGRQRSKHGRRCKRMMVAHVFRKAEW